MRKSILLCTWLALSIQAQAGTLFYFFETQFGDRVFFFRQSPISNPGSLAASNFAICESAYTCSGLTFSSNSQSDRIGFQYLDNNTVQTTTYFFPLGSLSTPGISYTQDFSFSARLLVGEMSSLFLYLFSGGISGSLGTGQLPAPPGTSNPDFLASAYPCQMVGYTCQLFGLRPGGTDNVLFKSTALYSEAYGFRAGTFSRPGIYSNQAARLIVAVDPFAIPEPGTVSLCAAGLSAIAAFRFRRRQ